MTNIVRTASPNTRQTYNRTAYVQVIYAVWKWIALLAFTAAVSMLLLLMMIVRTARTPVSPWRGSLLTLLSFEIDNEIKKAVAKTLQGDRFNGSSLSDYRVTLQING